MTSSRGILHEEMPRRGPSGNIYGFQLWVNLPAAQKMSQPRYQEVISSSIPTIEKNGATIRLVAGTIDGTYVPVTGDRRLASVHGREAGPCFEIQLSHPKRTYRARLRL